MRIEIYQDVRGEWRWRLVAANNRVMADSAEGYTRQLDVARAVETITVAFKADQVPVVDG